MERWAYGGYNEPKSALRNFRREVRVYLTGFALTLADFQFPHLILGRVSSRICKLIVLPSELIYVFIFVDTPTSQVASLGKLAPYWRF